MSVSNTTLMILFASFIALTLCLKIWISSRHIRNIQNNRDNIPDQFSSVINMNHHHKAADYTITKTKFGIIHTIYQGIILLLFTLGGGIEWLQTVTQPIHDLPVFQGAVVIMAYLILTGLLEIPFSLYQTFRIEERFGFNHQRLSLFFLDLLKSGCIGFILGLPLLLAVLWLMHASGSYWWIYAWLLWVSFNLLIIYIYPQFIAPFFNKFEPISDEQTRHAIESLLQQCGFQSDGIYVMDGSTRSAHGNAYFTGFGKNKRIVFFDTLVEKLSIDEIRAVLAHELGHFSRKHVLKRFISVFAFSLVFLWVLDQLLNGSWFYLMTGVETPSLAVGLLLLLIVSPYITFYLQPVMSWLSRKHEFEADEYAAENVNAQALIDALIKLYQDNASTLTPDPVYSAFYDSHPPALVRVQALQQRKG